MIQTIHMNSSHLFPTKKAEVETSHFNLPYYVMFTAIRIYFPTFLFSSKCTHKPFNKHWSPGKKENPNHHPLQTHLELNHLLYIYIILLYIKSNIVCKTKPNPKTKKKPE